MTNQAEYPGFLWKPGLTRVLYEISYHQAAKITAFRRFGTGG
jgi:hypothetical protein